MSQNFKENFKINGYTNFARIIFSRDSFSGKLSIEAKKNINELYSFLKKLNYPIDFFLDEEGKINFIKENIAEIIEKIKKLEPKKIENNIDIKFSAIKKYLEEEEKTYQEDIIAKKVDNIIKKQEPKKVEKKKTENPEEKKDFLKKIKTYIEEINNNTNKFFLDEYIKGIIKNGIGNIRNPENSTLKPFFKNQSYEVQEYKNLINYFKKNYNQQISHGFQQENLDFANLSEHIFFYILEKFFPSENYKILKTHDYDDKISKADFIIENKEIGKKISLDLTTNANFISAKSTDKNLLKKENVIHKVYNLVKNKNISEEKAREFLLGQTSRFGQNKIKNLIKMDNYVFPVEKTLMELFIKNFLEGFEKGIINPRNNLPDSFFEKTFKEYSKLNIKFYSEYGEKENNDILYFFIELIEKYKKLLK